MPDLCSGPQSVHSSDYKDKQFRDTPTLLLHLGDAHLRKKTQAEKIKDPATHHIGGTTLIPSELMHIIKYCLLACIETLLGSGYFSK